MFRLLYAAAQPAHALSKLQHSPPLCRSKPPRSPPMDAAGLQTTPATMFEYPLLQGRVMGADEFGLDDTWERGFGGTGTHAYVCSTCFACSMPQLSPPMDDLRLLHTARPWMIYAATEPVEVEPATPSSFSPFGLGRTCTPNKRPRHVSPAPPSPRMDDLCRYAARP